MQIDIGIGIAVIFSVCILPVLDLDPTLSWTSGAGSSYDPATNVVTMVEGVENTFTCVVTEGDEEPTVEFTLPQVRI